jgi:outer membrane protein, multidrug efflux system
VRVALWFYSSLAAVLGAGCTVGPDYVAPQPYVPDAWTQSVVDEMGADGAGLRSWWTSFQDPVLDRLVERAEANNRDLVSALWRIEAARAELGIARGEWLPSVDGGGDYTRFRGSKNDSFPVLGTIPEPENQNRTTVGLDASWELDVFGRIRRQVQAANAELDATVEDERDVRVVLFAQVASTYVDIRTLQQRIELARSNAQTQRDTLDLTQRRLDAGLVPALDVAQAESNLATTESEIPALREGLEAAMHRLAVLLGETPGSVAELIENTAALRQDLAPLGIGAPAELLRRRPDVRGAERRLAAQIARIGVATADLYPRFSLSGSYGYASLDGSQTLDSDSRLYAVGPSFRWNLFDGGRIRNVIAAQRALAEAATADYENTVLRALEETETALSAVKNERERQQKLAEAAAAAERAAGYVRSLYEEGLVDFQNVLDAQRTLFQAQDRRAASAGRAVDNLVQLYRALGGGWDDTSSVSGAPVSTTPAP